MKRLLAVVAGLVVALVGSMAVAAWLSSGSGAGTVGATSVLKAYTPSATPSGTSVVLDWDASTLADGTAVGGYEVVRHDGSTSVVVCQTAVTTCADPNPLPTEVHYGVVATIGSWRGPESDLIAFQYDGEAPVTSITVSPDPNTDGWNNTAVTVVLEAADSSGVDHIVFTLDGQDPVSAPGDNTMFTVSGPGDHVVTWYAVDTAGNTETTHTRTVRIDPSAPVTTATPTPAPNGAGWNNTDVSVALNATDADGSGVRSVTVGGVTTAGSTASTTVSAEGTTTVSYFATDVADNVEGTKSLVVRIDRTAPTASVDPAGGPSWTSDNTVAISASDATSGIASTQYAVDGGALQPYAGPVTLADGTRSFRYVVTDVAGNVTDHTVTIKVDSVKPTASLTQSGGGRPTVSGADATSGVASVSWRDGSSGSYTTVVGTSTTLSLAPGTHTIWYFATDNAGNAGSPTSTTITIAAPPVAPVLIACGGANGSKPYNLSWTWGPGNPNGGFKLSYADLSSGSLDPSTFTATARSGSTPDINSLSGTFKLVAIVDGVESAPATATFVANGSKACTIN